MSASRLDGMPRPSAPVCDRTAFPSSNSPSPLFGPAIVDLHSRPIAFLPTTDTEVKETGQRHPLLQLRGPDRGSLDFCLYALMGLGLCKSAPWVRRLSFGGIPEWYCAGGPYQLGGSHAIEPNCLCSTAVCFVQPDRRAEDSIPQYRLGTLAARWRQSQCTPTVLPARGPPTMLRI